MSDTIIFDLDGRTVEARHGDTVWEAVRRTGLELPHLCHKPAPGYRPDGNCRACLVEVEGERVLAASCVRKVHAGMRVVTNSDRAERARRGVFELLVADQPARHESHDPDSTFWQWAERLGVTRSRFPAKAGRPEPDRSHPAMAVNLDACIHCTLCVRACREVQVNDVIGMAWRGMDAGVVFDQADPMGKSTCVACGECVQACPTGALMEAKLLDTAGKRTVCPYCGVGCQVTFHIKDGRLAYTEGRDGPANQNRLCVKGRFGVDYIHHGNRLTRPLIRKEGVAKADSLQVIDPANPLAHFREASWAEALDAAAAGRRAAPGRPQRRRTETAAG